MVTDAHQIRVTVNGVEHQAEVEPRLLLVHFLRDVLRLTGTHIGCDTTHCGACTVLLDGKPIKSCTFFAVQAHGRTLLTVEGLSKTGSCTPSRKASGETRPPVWLLHAGYADDRLCTAAEKSPTDGRRDSLGHFW